MSEKMNNRLQEMEKPYVIQGEDDIKVYVQDHMKGGDENMDSQLLYKIDDVPPWYLSIILGLQHFLTMFGSTITQPLILAGAMCVGDDNVTKSEMLGTLFFVAGLVTVCQSTIGVRLPILQGGSFSFLVPTFAILALPQWKCPAPPVGYNETLGDGTVVFIEGKFTHDEHTEIWQSRMREVTGAITVASLFQVFIGFTGLVGLLLRFIGPLTIAPTISLIGLSLFGAASNYCSNQWGMSILTMTLIILFSQYLRDVDLPLCAYNKQKRCHISRFPFFKCFPIILAMLVAWLICYILTVTGALPDTPGSTGYGARTDIKTSAIEDAAWFRFPYPGQWGTPTVSAGAVFGMLAGVLAGMLESVGDYYACAKISGAPPPPIHAINRGIMIEGIGCVLSGIFGTGTGTTSYSQNIGAIGITKVASRRVLQASGMLLMLLGVIGKFGAIFVMIPDPVVGGVFMCMFGMLTAVGISNLQYIDLNSSRNLFIFGFSVFFGLSFPNWMNNNLDTINTGSEVGDQILSVLLSTSMFIGGIVGFVLDNTIPGTAEERGLVAFQTQHSSKNSEEDISATYDIPFITPFLRRNTIFKYIPICPPFTGFKRNK